MPLNLKMIKVVLTAVINNGDALRFADHTLLEDRNIVLAAVNNNGYALDYAIKFKSDEEIF